jgi:DNA modification methylase
VAAHRTGRRAYLCELSPRYADVILRRAEAEGLTCERVTIER